VHAQHWEALLWGEAIAPGARVAPLPVVVGLLQRPVEALERIGIVCVRLNGVQRRGVDACHDSRSKFCDCLGGCNVLQRFSCRYLTSVLRFEGKLDRVQVNIPTLCRKVAKVTHIRNSFSNSKAANLNQTGQC
jgi:hypothetical protein